jgi:hypothetical protein
MSWTSKTSELRRNDVVRCLSAPYEGRLFRIAAANGSDFVSVDVLTKSGTKDRRYMGWSGSFHGCEWHLIRRDAGSGLAPPAVGPATGEVAFRSLPPDMRTLIGQLVSDLDPDREVPEMLPLIAVATADLPEVPLDEHDRGSVHARAMNLDSVPPILVADGQFLDGKHRLFAARESRRETLAAIDLSGIADPRLVAANGMGPVGPRSSWPMP